jgi:hypothetical protein
MKNSVSQSIQKLPISFSIILFLLSSAYAAGVLDSTFGTNGRVITNIGNSARAAAIVIQPDGKIIVAGNAGICPIFLRFFLLSAKSAITIAIRGFVSKVEFSTDL